MLNITHGLLEFPLKSTQGYAATPISSTNRDAISTVINTLSAYVLSRFRNKLSAEIVNAPYKTLLDAN